MNRDRSALLFERAQKFIPGGVNSPVRAFKSVGGTPIFFESANGAILKDADGNEYIDYIGSWGPMILGHAFPKVIDAVQKAAVKSTSFGAPTEMEIEVAELITKMVPNVEVVRMVNSGTEACMSAVRVARGYTRRDKIIKFEGCYHGHGDAFLIKAGSGASTLGIPNSPGVTEGTAKDTLTATYNDLDSVQQIVDANRRQIAAIIIEPVAGNMGCIPPASGFLKGIRKICDQEDIVLIFDEVMTGFRLAEGGAQELYEVHADLMTFGKVIGGGMPVGAYGGEKELMDWVAPVGPVYQAGTLSGNPVAMASGWATLNELHSNPSIYQDLEAKGAYLEKGLHEILTGQIDYQINRVGSMISVHFTPYAVKDFEGAKQGDNVQFKNFFHAMLDEGVYLPPSAYETWFISNTHTTELLDKTLEAVKNSLEKIKVTG